VIHKVQYPLDFEGNWICLPSKVGPLWKMYSFKSNSWRKLNGVDMAVSYPCLMSLVNMNGLCHWLTQGYDMVWFDFSKEKFITFIHQ
jgi:hypothetical protein